MIKARTAFQIYKCEVRDSSVPSFSSLPIESALPYKIRAAEEALLASLSVVEESNQMKMTFAVSTLHSAKSYLSLLASFVPLTTRYRTKELIKINCDALVRVMILYSDDPAVFTSVKLIIAGNNPAGEVPISAISDLEEAVTRLEKKYRQVAKEAGLKVEMLRKVAPDTLQIDSADGSGATANSLAADAEITCSPQPEVTSQTSRGKRPRRSASNSLTKLSPSESAPRTVKLEGCISIPVRDGKPDGDQGSHHPKKLRQPKKLSSSSSTQSLHTLTRLRALTAGEKKVVQILNQMIQLLAHIYATKFNDLLSVWDLLLEKLQLAEEIMTGEQETYRSKDNLKLPEPFHEVHLDAIRMAIHASAHEFKEEEACRFELDEDLLHPIAYECMKVINRIEGYSTPPFPEPTEEERAKKEQARSAAKAKRAEAERKVLERAHLREALAMKKEEEKRLLRQRLGGTLDEDALVEDNEIKNAVPPRFVRYPSELPLSDAVHFERALYIWSVIVSLPRVLSLSQMPFPIFVKGLLEEDQSNNFLMEETVGCLLAGSMEHLRETSPTFPRITARGKTWFDALVEFVAVATGNKKRRQQPPQRLPSSSDGEESFSDDSDSMNSSSSYSDEEDETNSEAGEDSVEKAGAETKTPPKEENKMNGQVEETAQEGEDALTHSVKSTIERVVALRSLATWGNLDMGDRLTLLQFCVQELLGAKPVRDEAERLLKDAEESAVALEKRCREIREEAEKELKQLHKEHPNHTASHGAHSASMGSDEYEQRRAGVLDAAKMKRQELFSRHWGTQDGEDMGAIIRPLGMDRYKRLYWRFPLDRDIWVQSTEGTRMDFPLLPEPRELREKPIGASMLLDDDVDLSKSAEKDLPRPSDTDNNDSTGVQRTWGVIPAEYLRHFIEGLDSRGEREAALRHVLEDMHPYVESMKPFHEGRCTRARSQTFGYLNKLKSAF